MLPDTMLILSATDLLTGEDYDLGEARIDASMFEERSDILINVVNVYIPVVQPMAGEVQLRAVVYTAIAGWQRLWNISIGMHFLARGDVVVFPPGKFTIATELVCEC